MRSRRRGWKDRVLAEGDELLVLAEDQRIREAFITVRSTPPQHRDFTPLSELLGGDEAACVPKSFGAWDDSYELNGRIDVLRQQTLRCCDDSIVVRSCERDWIHKVELNPSAEHDSFRGNVGYVRATLRRFRRDSTGRWRHAETLQEGLFPDSRDVESICEGFTTDYSTAYGT